MCYLCHISRQVRTRSHTLLSKQYMGAPLLLVNLTFYLLLQSDSYSWVVPGANHRQNQCCVLRCTCRVHFFSGESEVGFEFSDHMDSSSQKKKLTSENWRIICDTTQDGRHTKLYWNWRKRDFSSIALERIANMNQHIILVISASL